MLTTASTSMNGPDTAWHSFQLHTTIYNMFSYISKTRRLIIYNHSFYCIAVAVPISQLKPIRNRREFQVPIYFSFSFISTHANSNMMPAKEQMHCKTEVDVHERSKGKKKERNDIIIWIYIWILNIKPYRLHFVFIALHKWWGEMWTGRCGKRYADKGDQWIR